mmetsp:Transcript_45414/g.126032  ORF Transcript_45414/g.126032 Transcript_45414/m.126032 type:complete len:214 (+) Transcript_45414:487-1128(+)
MGDALSSEAFCALNTQRRCFSSNVCVFSWSFSMPRPSAAMAIKSCSPTTFADGRQRRRSILWASQMSGKLSCSIGSNRPSCTGCNMMSHKATLAHNRVKIHDVRRRRWRCCPGKALSVSLRTTKSGSRSSMARSRQFSNQIATKRPAKSATRAQRCHVPKCGKQITRETAAAASSARHVKNSPASGGNAASPTFGGDRPQAATAATKETAAIR